MSNNFENDIKNNDIVVVDFFGNFCPPCKMLAPKFDELSKKYTDIKFIKINVEKEEELSSKYNIQVVPTILFFKNGELVARTEGANIKEIEKNILKLVVSSKAEPK